MANIMHTEVQIAGPVNEISRFLAAHIHKDNNGEDALDFNSVVPMPEELRKHEEHTDALVWALGGEYYSERSLLRRAGIRSADDTPLDSSWLRNLGITSREGLLRWAEEELPGQLSEARRALELERSTGYRNCHDWRFENWGCKWGCDGFGWLSSDKASFWMDTPWSAPSPIFHRLVELYPLLTFSCRFVEPGVGLDWVETYTA